MFERFEWKGNRIIKRKSKLNSRQEKFGTNVAKGMSQTAAYQDAYPSSSKDAAKVDASRLLTNANVSIFVQKRREEAIRYADIKQAEVLGETTRIAFASIEGAMDENGHFDFNKAVETGAASLIKKVTRTATQYGENVAFEFYSKADALGKLGEYLGMKVDPKENPASLTDEALARELSRRLRARDFTEDEVIEGVKSKFPNIDIQEITKAIN